MKEYDVEDWHLTPEGAAIHSVERTAVIADLHLGYEWARGASGDCVPAHSLDEAAARVERLFERASFTKLVVAGDFVESSLPCPAIAEDVRTLTAWLEERGVSLVVLEGNHDRVRLPARGPTRLAPSPLPRAYNVASWTIAHGERPLKRARVISGHHHPVVKFDGKTAPCFLVAPGRIFLPSFSSNAAGCDVLTAALAEEWRASALRCVVSTGSELLDLGPLSALRRRRRGPRSGSGVFRA
jgi:putative SbcD/Mre11-related phosphoesterase